MSAVHITIELPEDVAGDRSEVDLARNLRMLAVLDSYRQGEISTGRAAHLLGVSRPVLLLLASQHGVPSVNYPAGDLDEEQLAFDEARRQTG